MDRDATNRDETITADSRTAEDGRPVDFSPYDGPAGGWGSANSLKHILLHEQVPLSGPRVLAKQNKPDGLMCTSCAWPRPADHHPFEFCENGAKATAWEITPKRCGPDFFAAHTVTELRDWSDYALENEGRLTHPMRYDAASDRYMPVDWATAFSQIGAELARIRSQDPKRTVFYASGRASLETSYMWALLARAYGNNNLPDSANMCHETTGTALKPVIGATVGTVLMEDFKETDCLLFFGQNPGSNSPRMLHDLRSARKRGAQIITFNPLKERGLERFTSPQNPLEMATGTETQISTHYYQVRAGGDIAAILGLAKWLLEEDAIDHAFIEEHTDGLEEFRALARTTPWAEIEAACGLSRFDLETAASAYARSTKAIGIYGMGLTQHVGGVENVQMVVNLLLLRGNIGRTGAGICPVRGHSNVQGQRTVGIGEDPSVVPNDFLAERYGIEPPMEMGLNTVEACEAILRDEVDAFLALGGNFIRAIPDTARMEKAWTRLGLTVQIATKLNRSHLVLGRSAWLLPCLARSEHDEQATGRQHVSMEDSMTCIHASTSQVEPASEHLLSEPAIVAGIAKAALAGTERIDWDGWVADYGLVRSEIERAYPEQFDDFSKRMFQPGGFPRPLPARDRVWKTETGRARFTTPTALTAEGHEAFARADVLRLVTLRSNDQFNTTVYGYHDRFRGISGTRDVLLINRAEMARLGLAEGQHVTLASPVEDGVTRAVPGLRVTPYDIPDGCCGGYFPELNVLVPMSHHAKGSQVPASKTVPVVVRA